VRRARFQAFPLEGKVSPNGDGKVNVKDVSLIKRFISGLLSETELVLLNADINQDGKVNAKDITSIKKFIAVGE